MATLTIEQFNQLAPYEQNFRTAIYGKWSRYPGRHGLQLMEEIWRGISYPGFRLDYNCNTCVMNILTDVGKLWLAMKVAMDAAAEAAKTEPAPAPKKKVASSKKKATTVKAKAVTAQSE